MKPGLLIFIIYFSTCLLQVSGIQAQSNLPEFSHTQRDSLKNVNLERLEKDSFLIIFDRWNVGAYYMDTVNHYYFRNPFELLFFHRKKDQYFIQKIDNIEAGNDLEYDLKDLVNFLEHNMEKMVEEEFYEPTDTSYFKDGTMLISMPRRVSHELIENVWIYYQGKELRYKFPQHFENYPENEDKKRVVLIGMLRNYTAIVANEIPAR